MFNSKYIYVLLIFSSLIEISCSSNPIKGKWKIIGVSVDKIDDSNKDIQPELLNYKPSKILYSDFRNGILFNYLGHRIETTNYYMSRKDLIIFYGLGFENDTSRILKLLNDTATIRSNKGSIIRMVRVNTIPGS